MSQPLPSAEEMRMATMMMLLLALGLIGSAATMVRPQAMKAVRVDRRSSRN